MRPAPLQRSLTTLPLVFILYFTTSGGPFSTESLVAQVGPGIALLTLALVPLVFSLPEILLVGELASMLPVEGGYYRWVERAFGPFWAFQNGWLTWMYSLVDMALYPILFTEYLTYFVPSLGAMPRYAVALAVIWGATLVNLRGAARVGRASILSAGFIIVGFLAVSLAAVPRIDHAPWTPFAATGERGVSGLAVGLSIALWNYIGWDNASTVQGEVRDPSRTYPRALAATLPLVAAGYLVPLATTLGATGWTTWTDGGWPQIALAAGGRFGPVLAAWVALAGMVSALGLFNALLLGFSRLPYVMGTDGLLPRTLAATDARGTPRNAVLAAAVVYSAFVLIPFHGLVVADVVLYCLALFMEFAALVALRVREPTLRGAFRIPLGPVGVGALALLPTTVLLAVVVLSFLDGEYGTPAIVGAGVAIVAGPIAYRIAERYRARRAAYGRR